MTRCARSLLVLLAEVNARNPNRDRTSDGGLGDAAHAARVSSHNVDRYGVYRARDFDKDGIDATGLAELVRKRGQAGDPRLRNGGYVIWNRRIAGPDGRGWQWRAYDGENAHTHHVHVSCTDDPAHYDDDRPWGWFPPLTTTSQGDDEMTPEDIKAVAAAAAAEVRKQIQPDLLRLAMYLRGRPNQVFNTTTHPDLPDPKDAAS